MIPCYQNAQKNLFGQDIIDGLTDAKAIAFRKKCNCLTGCVNIKYEAVIDRAKFGFEERVGMPPNSTTNAIILILIFVIIFFHIFICSNLTYV